MLLSLGQCLAISRRRTPKLQALVPIDRPHAPETRFAILRHAHAYARAGCSGPAALAIVAKWQGGALTSSRPPRAARGTPAPSQPIEDEGCSGLGSQSSRIVMVRTRIRRSVLKLSRGKHVLNSCAILTFETPVEGSRADCSGQGDTTSLREN